MEDPYFESPPRSPLAAGEFDDSTEDLAGAGQSRADSVLHVPSLTLNGAAETQADDAPPPLPVRTPDSWVLAADPEHAGSKERLAVIIPPNAAALAVRELGDAEKPPSPVPPLPERTPESFELATGEAGGPSGWCCDSTRLRAPEEHKPWTRSKSLKVNATSAAPPAAPGPVASRISSSFLPLPPPPPPPPAAAVAPAPPPANTPIPPHAPQAAGDPVPALPQRTADSLVLELQHMPENIATCWQDSQTTLLVPRIGTSSEWAGSSQPKRFLDVFMRSKSVRAKSSRQEPPTLLQQAPSSPLVSVGAGSAEVPQGGEAPGDRKDPGKGMSRTRSLKFFRHKAKPKAAAPPDLPQSGSPNGTSTSLFKFGFGTRFGKPKGPRSHPDTWQ